MIEIVCNCRSNYYPTTARPVSNEYSLAQDGFGPLTISQLKRVVQGKRGCVFVHGYRSELTGVAVAYATLLEELVGRGLDRHYDFIVRFFWPGGWAVSSWPFSNGIRADMTVPNLMNLLLDLADAGARVDVNAHSLGARIAMQAPAPVRHLFLVAPAVPTAYPLRCPRVIKTANVFYSRRDRVLQWGFRLGSWGQPALGWEGPRLGSGLAGYDFTESVSEHGGYRTTEEYYTRWLTILLMGAVE